MRVGKSGEAEVAGDGFGVSAWAEFSLFVKARVLHWESGWGWEYGGVCRCDGLSGESWRASRRCAGGYATRQLRSFRV